MAVHAPGAGLLRKTDLAVWNEAGTFVAGETIRGNLVALLAFRADPRVVAGLAVASRDPAGDALGFIEVRGHGGAIRGRGTDRAEVVVVAAQTGCSELLTEDASVLGHVGGVAVLAPITLICLAAEVALSVSGNVTWKALVSDLIGKVARSAGSTLILKIAFEAVVKGTGVAVVEGVIGFEAVVADLAGGVSIGEAMFTVVDETDDALVQGHCGNESEGALGAYVVGLAVVAVSDGAWVTLGVRHVGLLAEGTPELGVAQADEAEEQDDC